MGLTVLAHAHMPLKFWVEAFQTVVYTINLLLASLFKFQSPLNFFTTNNPIICNFSPLDVLAFLILNPITSSNSIFILPSVRFLVIAMFKLDIRVCIHREESMCLDMCSLI